MYYQILNKRRDSSSRCSYSKFSFCLHRNYELQLNFKNKELWNSIKPLNMVLKYKVNGKERYSKVIKIGKIDGDETKVYPLPKYDDVYDMRVIIFDDTLDAYAKYSGIGLRRTLQFAENYYKKNDKNPIIILNTKTMKRSEQLLLSPIDTDKDGIPNTWDAFPNNENYQFDSDKDGMPDKWEEENGLNIYNASDGQKDNDDDNLTNLQEYQNGTDPKKEDSDGDGFNDGDEVARGTNPNDENDYPEMDIDIKIISGTVKDNSGNPISGINVTFDI